MRVASAKTYTAAVKKAKPFRGQGTPVEIKQLANGTYAVYNT